MPLTGLIFHLDKRAKGDLKGTPRPIPLGRGGPFLEGPLHVRVRVRPMQIQDVAPDRDGVGELVTGLTVSVAQGIF